MQITHYNSSSVERGLLAEHSNNMVHNNSVTKTMANWELSATYTSRISSFSKYLYSNIAGLHNFSALQWNMIE